METAYIYSIENDFPNRKVNLDCLTKEIESSSISVVLFYLSTRDDVCDIHFKNALSDEEKSILDDIVAGHSGTEPVKDSLPVHLSSPYTSDGKPIVFNNIFPGNVSLYITGSADDCSVVAPASGRGDGVPFFLSSESAGESTLEFQFCDWVYLAGGGIQSSGTQVGDSVSLKLYAPATPVTPNAAGTGNCTIESGMIVPAQGNGTHDVDLAQAVPVPSASEDDRGTGYYDWNESSTGKGLVWVSAKPKTARYDLYTVPVDLSRFVNRYPLTDQYIDLTVTGIKPKKILPQWCFKVTLTNSGHSGLKIAWNLVLARTKSV